MLRSLALGLLAGIAALVVSPPANADHVPSLELAVLIEGAQAGVFGEDDLGCSSLGGDVFECSGGGLQLGGTSGILLDSWDLDLDSDPVITGFTTVTNLSGVAQQFTLIFTLPTSVLPSSLMGGSIQGGMTDNDGDGVTLAAPTGSAFYTALIDGVSQQLLYADPTSFSAGAFASGNVPNAAWGTPIPSALGPAVLSNIRIQLDYVLSGNDSASFTSNFVVVPVPEPGSGLLLAFGLGVLALRRR